MYEFAKRETRLVDVFDAKKKKNVVQLTTAVWIKGARIDFLHRKFLTVK